MNLILISRNLEKLEATKQEILLINPKIKVEIIMADFAEGEKAFCKIRPHLKDVPIGILGNKIFLFIYYFSHNSMKAMLNKIYF